VNNIIGMNEINAPQTPRLQLLSPLNATSGVFERRKASQGGQGLKQLNAILMKPDNAYNSGAPNHTEIGFALNNSPTRNINMRETVSPRHSNLSPMPDLVGDDLKPLTLKERLMRQKQERLNGVKNAELKCHQDMMTLPSEARKLAASESKAVGDELTKLVQTSPF